MRKLILTMLVGFAFMLNATAQDRTITGKVIDDKGVAIEGVSVVASDGKNGVKTNKDGNYSILISKNVKSLLFSSVGYEAQGVTITNLQDINVSLKSIDTRLDEIVIVGYETKRKRDISALAEHS